MRKRGKPPCCWAASLPQRINPCGLSSATPAAGWPSQSGWRRSSNCKGKAGRSTQASRPGVELFIIPSGAAPFVLEHAQSAGKPVIRNALLFGMSAQRNQRAQRKSRWLFFTEPNQRAVMPMGETGQARLQRHGNIGAAEIEDNDAETAGAQKFFAGAGDTVNAGQTNNHQRG